MPTYKVTDPETGRTVRLTGDSPPTESELHDVFSQMGPMRDAVSQPPSDPNYEVAQRTAPANAMPMSARDVPSMPETPGVDVARALLTNEPTQGFTEGMIRSAPASIGGAIGATAGAGVASIPGAALGGAAGESFRQGAAQVYAGAMGRPFTPLGQVFKDTATQGVAQGGTQAIGVGLAAAKPWAVKVGSQGMRALAGIPEKAGAAALRDPSILTRALPIDEAGQAYAASTGGLKSGAEGARAALGKSYFSGDAIADKFDELAPKLMDGSLDTQTALTLRQTTMQAIEDLPFKQQGLRRVLAKNIDALDSLLEQRLPEWAGAKTGYRESKIAGEFSSLLPLNKNLSPNVLRTTAAIAAAGKGLAEGKPYLALGLPMISPAVYGAAIKGAAIAGKLPAGTYRLPAGAAAGSLADWYTRAKEAEGH